MLKLKTNRLTLTSFAVWLSLAAVPTLSASSIFDIPLPTTCINSGGIGCPGGSRVNASVAQQNIAPDYIGDIFYSPVSENISSLAIWVAVPEGNSASTDLGSLSLYLGSIGSAQTDTIGVASTSYAVTASQYPDGQQYQSLYSSDMFNIYEVNFSLSSPFSITGGCGDPTAGCYAWAVTSDGNNFAPLISYQPNQFTGGDTAIDGGDGHTYGAFTYFTGGAGILSVDTNIGQANESTITSFGLAPSVDFVTNPEPATLGLLVFGFGLIGLKARRSS